MRGRTRFFRRIGASIFALSFPCLLLAQGDLSTPESLDAEFSYAAALIKLGLPDYAEMIANRVALRKPDAADRANVVRAEALIFQRRFKQAEDIVASMPKDNPKAQAITLALADGYFQTGDMEKCRAYYQAFFKQHAGKIPEDPDLLRFFRESAYKFAQMLVQQNDAKAASEIYDLVLQAGADPAVRRQVSVEQAELILKAVQKTPAVPDRDALLAKAETNCTEVLWGDMDLWFGRGIIALANIQVQRGQNDQAIGLLQSNMRMLKKLDELLAQSDIPISESPYAGARSLLGSLSIAKADLLMGAKPVRDAEAIQYFERVLSGMTALWGVMVNVSQRDVGMAAREKRDKAALRTPERLKPFDDFSTTLTQLGESLAASGMQGPSAEKAAALTARLRELAGTADGFDKESGVTPGPDVILDDTSKIRRDFESGRLLLADDDKRKAKAIELYTAGLQSFYGIFANYPGSDWSAMAGEKVTALEARLSELTGKRVSVQAGKEGSDKLAQVTLREGHSLFSRQEYAKAIQKFMAGLAVIPEGPDSVVALSALMECHGIQKDSLRVKLIADYLSERFSEAPEAAQALLRIGRVYFESKDRDMYNWIYELYLRRFPKHDAAPAILYMLGEQFWTVKDYPAAVAYYQRIVTQYPKTPYHLKALSRIGWSHYLNGDFKKAADTFLSYQASSHPGPEKAQTKLCLADSYRQLQDFPRAVNQYKELSDWLLPKENPYSTSKDDQAKNQEVLEQALFFQAYCYGRLEKPVDRVPAYRQAAISQYRKFVAEYPKSAMAPTALSSMGAVLLADGKSEEAAQAFKELSSKYPDSEAGQNARFSMIRSLFDIGQGKRAASVFDEMVRDADKYPPEQFSKLGQLMMEQGDSESAERAFDAALKRVRASDSTPDTLKRNADLEQRALLGLGQARFGHKNYAGAVESLDDLVVRYPRSGLFYEARFLLGRAYKELGKPAEAAEILKDIFKRAADRNLIDRATLELAAIQISQGDKAGALASYQRIVLLGRPDTPDSRTTYRLALAGSIPIFIEMEKWQDAADNCANYLRNFPSGDEINQVRSWRSKATMNLSGNTGGTAP